MNTIILNNIQIQNKIVRLAHQILENNFDEQQLIIVGLNERGNILATDVCSVLKNIFDGELLSSTMTSKRNADKKIFVSTHCIQPSKTSRNSDDPLTRCIVDKLEYLGGPFRCKVKNES